MTLTIHLLGPVQLSRDYLPISVRGYKAVALLAYLLLTGKAHTRQHLIDLLFNGPADPRASLRWILSQLRLAIGPDFILADRQKIAFNFDSDYCLDVARFEAGQLDLYRGDFLEGLNVRDAIGFERERLRMTQATEMGAILMPSMPAFYHRPHTLDLFYLELPADLFRRWRGPGG